MKHRFGRSVLKDGRNGTLFDSKSLPFTGQVVVVRVSVSFHLSVPVSPGGGDPDTRKMTPDVGKVAHDERDKTPAEGTATVSLAVRHFSVGSVCTDVSSVRRRGGDGARWLFL